MKNYALFLFFITFITQAQTQPSRYADFELRIKAINKFSTEALPIIKENLIQSQLDIGKFENTNLLADDKNQKSVFLEKIANNQKLIENAEGSITTSSTKKLMTDLDKTMKEKALYDKAKKEMETIEKEYRNSPKLTKYFELLEQGKYTSAKIKYALLNQEEKGIAERYEQHFNYTAREVNSQEYLKTSIKKLENEIAYNLSYPENAILQIQSADQETHRTISLFNDFKNTITGVVQFDYKLPSEWDLGLFSCEAKNKPKYLRFKNYPNLVVLDNEGTYNSVIKLSLDEPKKLDVVYHCSKMGSFGACLENKEKKLCRLDANCGQNLSEMEKAFDRNKAFVSIQSTMGSTILANKKSELQDPKSINMISEFAKINRLGFYTKDQLLNLMDPLIEKSKNIVATNPEDFYRKLKLELTSLEKSEQVRLQNIPGFSSNKSKKADTLNALSYLIASIDGDMVKIKETDAIQEFTFKSCSSIASEFASFCQLYTSFKSGAKRFEEVEEIQNFVANECPRVVFRFEGKNPKDEDDFSECKALTPSTEKEINNLLQNVNDVLNK
jgi:hypothetical protein